MDSKEYFENEELIEPFNKKFLGNIIAEIFNTFSIMHTSMMLDRMKDLALTNSHLKLVLQ